MRRETILKIVLVLTMGVLLFAMPAKVFAAPTDLPIDLNDIEIENQGGLDDLQKDPEPTPPANPTPETQKPEEKLPEAGLAEDTVMVISIIALVAMATFAYKKVNEYSNI